MKQLKKTLLTLVALLAVTAGAWAEESETINTATDGTTVYTGTHFKITASLGCDGDGIILWSGSTSGTATIEALNGENITKIEMHMSYGGQFATYTTTTAGKLVATNSDSNANDISVTDINATSVTIGTSQHEQGWIQINKFVIYYAAAAPITVEPVEGKTNEWTFSMPGSDVVLTPIYAKAAAFATTGTGSEAKTLLPEAAEGVIAGTDAPLIADGTGIVANIGSTETAQGTLMYAIGTSDTEAPALTAFSATVPTAKGVADDGADVYVWYYIQGADAPDGDAATLDNTFDNTEPACLTVQVLTNKFDITLNAANANTIEAGKATVTVGGTEAEVKEGKLQGVKMGSEVKLKAATGYKFRKVEVKKGAAAAAKTITIGDVELTYADGDTWETIVSKNSDKIKILAGLYIVQVAQPAPNKYKYIHVWYTEVKPSDIIDPSKNYQWDTMETAH